MNLTDVVILVVTEDGTVQEFIKDKGDFLQGLTDVMKEWKEQNGT